MKKEPNLSKQLVAVLQHAYCRTLKAREAVEHRITSMPEQEKIVQLWKENIDFMINKNYPGHAVDSYPVITRRSREIEKLERYRRDLPERLNKYSDCLKELERVFVDVRDTVSRAQSRNFFTRPWPKIPEELLSNPWPENWPKIEEQGADCKEEKIDSYSKFVFEKKNTSINVIQPSPKTFEINISGNIVVLEARYENGISEFEQLLCDFLDYRISSRWRAIEEAMRTGIRWPKLDKYLSECENPWLPEELVSEKFALRGTLTYRDELADLMGTVSVKTGRLYFQLSQRSYRISHNIVSHDQLNELIHAGLASWGEHMKLAELVRHIPFPEWKSIFILSDLPPPRSFTKVQEKFQELVSKRGIDDVRQWMHKFFQQSDIFDVLDPPGYSHEDFLGIRSRANVMVSTLVLLSEGSLEPLRILRWP